MVWVRKGRLPLGQCRVPLGFLTPKPQQLWAAAGCSRCGGTKLGQGPVGGFKVDKTDLEMSFSSLYGELAKAKIVAQPDSHLFGFRPPEQASGASEEAGLDLDKAAFAFCGRAGTFGQGG